MSRLVALCHPNVRVLVAVVVVVVVVVVIVRVINRLYCYFRRCWKSVFEALIFLPKV